VGVDANWSPGHEMLALGSCQRDISLDQWLMLRTGAQAGAPLYGVGSKFERDRRENL
jgi:hypothetical protein